MAESHRPADHYGWVGEHQLRWFADRLCQYRDQGWLRLAAVHHNAVRKAVADDENLRDADDLDQILGQPGLVNLLLHGHTHDGRLHRLSSGLLALSTGSAAVTAKARPQEVPNQYQLLTVRPSGITRYARQYALGQRRWIGDTRISANGSHWRHDELCRLQHVHGTFTSDQQNKDQRRDTNHTPDQQHDRSAPGDAFFDRVLEVTYVRYPEATVTPRPADGYMRVSEPLPVRGIVQRLVGVVDGEVTGEKLKSFVQGVHGRFFSATYSVRSELVYSGSPVAEILVTEARRQGVRLCSFVDYQGLTDLRPLVARQAERLATDPIYRPQLYAPQQYRLLDDEPTATYDDLLTQVIRWLGADSARLVLVLGDPGRGKTFLLRELARTLIQHLPDVQPVLLELQSLEKAPSLEELLARHLIRENMNFNLQNLQYMIQSGQLALLFDGFDILERRVGFDDAVDYVNTFLRAVIDKAKIVLTSRTQHFESTAQIRAALGPQVTTHDVIRVAVLEDFTSA